jgi:hypothetical protein
MSRLHFDIADPGPDEFESMRWRAMAAADIPELLFELVGLE